MDLPQDVIDKFKQYGSAGGKKTKKLYGKEHFAEMGRKSAENKAKLKEIKTSP
jgi:hypothetical protein